MQIEEVDERHYGTEGEHDTFVVHFFHAPSGAMVAPDWDATSWSVSVIRVTDAAYRAAFAWRPGANWHRPSRLGRHTAGAVRRYGLVGPTSRPSRAARDELLVL